MTAYSPGDPAPGPGQRAAIIIVNWNGWRDTIDCLESVLALDGFAGAVIVCDNGSTDESIRELRLWHSERRPVNFDLLELGTNLGFAAGNNAGLRRALNDPSIDIFWFLNNDAVAFPDAFVYLRRAFEDSTLPRIAGSVLLEHSSPQIIQACGGSFDSTTFRVAHLLAGQPSESLKDLPDLVPVDYPVGASMAVNRAWIDRVGLMSESYFLYYEELDWVIRADSSERPVIATRSRVLHKGGASTGGASGVAKRSLLADRCHLRGRIILAGRMGRMAFLRAVTVSSLVLPKRFVKGRAGAGMNATRAIADGIREVMAEWRHRP